MLRRLQMQPEQAREHVPKEGELYKLVQIGDHSFPLYYGYYEKCDRDNPAMEPMPIYPDFTKAPHYTRDGFPIVTQMQDGCEFFDGDSIYESDCADCRYFAHADELIGLCTCPKNRRLHPELRSHQPAVENSSA